MALNGLNFNYALKDGKLSVDYTDKNGKKISASGDDVSSIFTNNGYTDEQAEQIIADLLNSQSFDKNLDSVLSDEEIESALKEAAESGNGPVNGPTNPSGGANGVDPATGEQPETVTPTAEETKTNEYKDKTNTDLAASQGDAQKNYDASEKDMGTAKTSVSDAKDAFQETTATQDELVKAAEDELNYTHENYDEIKEKYGEAIAKALDDVKTKQEAENEAQTKVNELTGAVADATTAVSEATSALADANAALTDAQAALDSAPLFIENGQDEQGNPIMQPNPEIPTLKKAVADAEAAVKQAEETLEQRKTELAEKEEELQTAETALDEAVTARNESQKVYEETVENSEFAEDEALKAITAAVKGVSEAQDNRKTAIDEAKQAVTTATNTLKEASETFNNNQKALNEINREVNTRKAKGIWDASSDKTPEEIEAEKAEEADKADEAKEETEGEETEEGDKKDEEVPTKGNAADAKKDLGKDVVTFAMVKDEIKLAEDNGVNLKDYVYAKGQDGIFHIYNASTGKSIAREYGKQGSGLDVWGGGYDIVGNGSGYLKEYQTQSDTADWKTVYSYDQENPDVVHVSEKQYSTSSPLSFDIDGNGIGTTDEMISYDIDGDGKMDNIFNSADAVLVFDKDGDGISGKDGSECFGDNTDIDGDGKADGYKDGFEALKALAEQNHLIGGDDTTLDKNDIAFLEQKFGLRIKAGGYTSDATSLFDLGITSINLAKTDKTSTDYNFDGKGNELMHQEGATFEINGEEREYADLWHRKFAH